MKKIEPSAEIVMGPTDIVSIRADESVLGAAKTMRENHVGCLVVTDEHGKIAGMVSERDIVNRVVAGLQDPTRKRVNDIMTAHVASCPPGTPIWQARELMVTHGVRHLPIVEDGAAVGIVSVRDVVAQLLSRDRAMRAAAEQIAMLSTCLKRLDFDEVVNMVAGEVPKIFGAKRCVLCLPKTNGGEDHTLLARRHNCPCPDQDLQGREYLRETHGQRAALCTKTPAACQQFGCKAPIVLIPLHVSGFAEPAAGSAKSSRGYLCMCGLNQPASFSEELIGYKGALVREVLNANLTNARLYHEVKRRSITDALTGVGTRRVFEDKLETERIRAERYGRPFCVAILDVDQFKSINDRLGHAAGDRVLKEIGRRMLGEKRASDVLARYGGDEFVLLMPETALTDAIIVLERVRVVVGETRTADGISMTVSCGVVEQSGPLAGSSNELVRRADLALYEAKRTGRDRTETWERISTKLGHADLVESERVSHLQNRIAEMSAESKEMFVQSIWGLVRALEAKDHYTKDHSENVMRYSVGIAETMGFEPADVVVIRRGAMVHDIGKIGIPDSILRKSGDLTRKERRVIEQHPLIAVKILDQMRFLEREMPIVRHHHERWDGQGYPDGLKEIAIPRGARVLAVADAFDAITSDRVYRNSRSLPEAMQILTGETGDQFDPEVVDGMVNWVASIGQKLGKPDGVTTKDLLDSQLSCSVAA